LNFPIPVPPLAEQERIVSILDKFDALVNDLSDPACPPKSKRAVSNTNTTGTSY
jgi:restriction endonuclease S subunit